MKREVRVKSFTHGITTVYEERTIPRGAASYSKNFLTKGDKIELRLGYKLIGTEIVGNGRISGIYSMADAVGVQKLFASYGRKVKFYNSATSDFVEIGTNLLPAAADGEDIAFSGYASLSGYQLFFSSPNSSIYKVLVANPADYIDFATEFKGKLSIKQNRTTLWGRTKDKTGVYMSYIDDPQYTTVSGENIGTGDGVLETFTDTLAFKAGNLKNHCFAIVVTDGTETFSDNYAGILTGNLGGTGTINYTTGAISVTFNTAPAAAQAITCSYQHELSTNKGILDFSSGTPRLAGQGVSFRQDDGGSPIQSILSYEDIEYCLHFKKAWSLKLTIDDTNAENVIFRDSVGVPNWRAAFATGEGIYYIDNTDETDPYFGLITLSPQTAKVLPIRISSRLNLKDYLFDRSVVFELGDLILFACREKGIDYNNIIFVYDRKLKIFDLVDYSASCFTTLDGTLIAGDDLSNNVYELFSGYDDDDSNIDGEWVSGYDNLDNEELKKCKELVLMGEITADQSYEVYVAADNDEFVKVGDVSGSGDYVDASQNIYVGSTKIGESTIGGSSPSAIIAHPYVRRIKLSLGKFYEIKIKFKSTGLGYLSISSYFWRDIRLKGHKLPNKYRTTNNV